jgi:hypothetical protein
MHALERADLTDQVMSACSNLRSTGVLGAVPMSSWLFGSRAAGCARSSSDWDVLVVVPTPETGCSRRVSVGTLDLVVVSVATGSGSWLASELAAHVADFGQLLFGQDCWRPSVDRVAAAERKLSRTMERAIGLHRAWLSLSMLHRERRALALRLDVQRADALRRRGTVPPTAHLRQEWLSFTPQERRRILAPFAFPAGRLRRLLLSDGRVQAT